ncbi:MAG TPA: hypothetical protein VGH65_01965 [Verrucomicrobiaceae bacterium]
MKAEPDAFSDSEHPSDEWRIVFFTNELSQEFPDHDKNEIVKAVTRAIGEIKATHDRDSLKTRALMLLGESRSDFKLRANNF